MCKSLIRRIWMVALVLLFTAGLAVGQMAQLPFQNTIAWGGPIQPDVGSGDKYLQPVTSPDVGAGSPAGVAAAPGETPADSPAGNAASDSPNNNASTNTDSIIRRLGTPFPLQLQPQGLKIGPMYLTTVSDTFFFVANSSTGFPTETAEGNSLAASLVYSKPISRGIFVVQAQEQFSVSRQQPYYNQSVSATFNEQLSERWSLTATAQFTYFQNSILANPQYLLSYTNGGFVQQTPFVQRNGTNIYESNNISTTYQLSGRTQISFYPILGAQFQYVQGGWSNVHEFGGGVSVIRTLTPDISVNASYSLYYSATSGAAASSSNWVSQNIGVGFQGTFLRYKGWLLSGGVSATSQRYAGSYTLTPTGTLRLLKSFGQSSVSAAYTRTEASNVLVSNGYYDQGDIAYNRRIGTKMFVNAGVGAFRTFNTGGYNHGKRAGASVSYLWSPRLSLNAGYNFAHQASSTPSTVYLGNVNYLSFGLTWLVGAQSGL